MEFKSTRNDYKVSSAQAIAQGLSNDGGLFVPTSFPSISLQQIKDMTEMTYEQRSAFILSQYLTDFVYDELLSATKQAYSKFDGDAAPVLKVDENLFVLELFHGPTFAFKDIALTLLPHLLILSKNKVGIKEDIMILVATSGDTGKAALEGFKNVKGTKIMVFFPSEGVSNMQKKQMTTQDGDNVFVAGIKGNFDECQSYVKKIFSDKKITEQLLKDGIVLSSANSINFGRLVPQIVYYFSAYCDMLASGEIKDGDKINFVVPTGNFGNILAGFYAKEMGLPINKLICASNKNNVLTEFFNSGVYDTNREFFKTISPSMDILISSNLERLVYFLSGNNCELTKERMDELKKTGKYEVSKEELARYSEDFFAGYADEDEVMDTIADFYDEYDYPLDPHTAVAMKVCNDYIKLSKDEHKTVIVSTASPFKFAENVYLAISEKEEKDPFVACKKLAMETALQVPENLSELEEKEIRFDKIYNKDELNDLVLNCFKRKN